MDKENTTDIPVEQQGFEIITKRPDDMPYEDYKTYRRVQNKVLRKYRKGKQVWVSKLIPTEEVMKLVSEEEYKEFAQLLIKGASYVKPKNDDDVRTGEDLPQE